MGVRPARSKLPFVTELDKSQDSRMHFVIQHLNHSLQKEFFNVSHSIEMYKDFSSIQIKWRRFKNVFLIHREISLVLNIWNGKGSRMGWIHLLRFKCGFFSRFFSHNGRTKQCVVRLYACQRRRTSIGWAKMFVAWKSDVFWVCSNLHTLIYLQGCWQQLNPIKMAINFPRLRASQIKYHSPLLCAGEMSEEGLSNTWTNVPLWVEQAVRPEARSHRVGAFF